ncbi:MAG TPA: MFS transporter [Candidatus Binatia bacterium]|nr:MFS transporter [Candidatus Binatia bacterium]
MRIGLRLVAFMIAGEVFAMLGSSAVAATLPTLIAQWHLSSLQAGWLSGAYFIGYAVAVPVLVSLTDRFDSRFIFALGCALGVVANFAFAFLAGGLAAAAVFWALAGVSLAGVYMPGLRVIIDGLEPGMRLRAVPYYTASFGIGTSLSFLAAGTIAQWAGWRAAFAAGGCGCIVAMACLVLAILGAERRSPSSGSGTFDVREVLRNRAAMRYILAYGGHCWELFALRAWLVALLFFFWNSAAGGAPGRAITYWSSAITLVGVPSSIVGAEFALRVGRRRLIATAAIASMLIAVLTGLFGARMFLTGAIALVFYSIAITGDSAALTTGVVDVSDEATRGSTLALHSLIGFVAGGLGPMAVGVALAFGGGVSSGLGWTLALIVMAAGSGVALLAVR